MLAALVAVALVAVIYAAYSAAASKTYSGAVAAHKRFDCSEAANKYGRVVGLYALALPSHRGLANDRRAECRKVLEAESAAQDRNHQDAARLYGQILDEHRSSPIVDKLKERRAEELLWWGDSLMRRASENSRFLPVALTRYETVISELPQTSRTEAAKKRIVRLWAWASSGGACARADSMLALTTGEYVSEEAQAVQSLAAKDVPGDMLGCGKLLISKRHYSRAVGVLRLLIREFGGTGAARRAKGPLIDAEVGQIRGGGTAALSEPTVSGSTGGGEVGLDIRNATPYPIELLLSGPSSRRFTVPRCSGCREFSKNNPPTSCPPGANRTFVLRPGAYSAVVRALGQKVTPWAGDWSLAAGVRYGHCFYIVTSPLSH